jgi:hypothetical protein
MRLIKTCFLIDATASMSPYVESAKRQARVIMETVRQEHPDSTFLFGAVFYRDFRDSPQYEVFPFQEDITDSIRNVQTHGGGDIPEDVAGGYQKVLQMDWSHATTKFVFHIADAPPHGEMWHDSIIVDHYPNPDGPKLEDLILQASIQDIHLAFVRINDSTNQMIQNFRNVYHNEIHVMELELEVDSDIDETVTISAGRLDRLISGGITRHISETLSLMD